jgi:MoxR-like ATPase
MADNEKKAILFNKVFESEYTKGGKLPHEIIDFLKPDDPYADSVFVFYVSHGGYPKKLKDVGSSYTAKQLVLTTKERGGQCKIVGVIDLEKSLHSIASWKTLKNGKPKSEPSMQKKLKEYNKQISQIGLNITYAGKSLDELFSKDQMHVTFVGTTLFTANEPIPIDAPYENNRASDGIVLQDDQSFETIEDIIETAKKENRLIKFVPRTVDSTNPTDSIWKIYRELCDQFYQKKTNRTNNMKDFTMTDLEKNIYQLLKSNHQVILTGAPGTGKTYTAKKVAMALAKDTWVVETDSSGKRIGKWQNGRIASVQFHPGYDYSDFIVGMKPVLVDGENNVVKAGETGKGNIQVSFRWTDGVFKLFANDAKNAFDAWVATAGHKPEDAPKFVFLIDEINRADLSRVFGELFSLLEEEYRYPNDDGSDSILLPDGKLFSIPKNLYIIGTMNDIDRSVESMDFALRRRFAWKEVKPENTMDDILREIPEKDTLRAKMKAVNDLIRSDERLGDQYQLGGAIFAKLEKYVERNNGTPKRAKPEAFDHLWENHIQNILFEYLRGRSEPEKSLGDLRTAYDKATKGGPSSAEDTDWKFKRIKISFPDGSFIADDPGGNESVTTLLRFVEKVCNSKAESIQIIMDSPELSGKNKFLIEESEWNKLREKMSKYRRITVNDKQYYVLTNIEQNVKVRHIQTISKLLNLGVTVSEV